MEQGNLKYKLQRGDYRLLWLLMSPEEIAEEFKERAVSPRQIRRMFSGISKSRTNYIKKRLVNEIGNVVSPDDNPQEKLEEELARQRQEALESIWKAIRDKEEEWASI